MATHKVGAEWPPLGTETQEFRVPKFWGAEFPALRCPSEPRWSAIGLQTRFLIHSKPIEQGPHPLTTTECHGPTTRGPKLTPPKGVDS